MAESILFMTHHRGSRKPWESFPAFARWTDEQTPKEDNDGLRGVRAAASLSGEIGILNATILDCLSAIEGQSDLAKAKDALKAIAARILMGVNILADEIGFNPIRTLTGPIDEYVIPLAVAYGITAEIPISERGYFLMNYGTRISRHLLPVGYIVAINRFTFEEYSKEDASGDLLKGVHELQSMLDALDIKMSDALKFYVRSFVPEPEEEPNG